MRPQSRPSPARPPPDHEHRTRRRDRTRPNCIRRSQTPTITMLERPAPDTRRHPRKIRGLPQRVHRPESGIRAATTHHRMSDARVPLTGCRLRQVEALRLIQPHTAVATRRTTPMIASQNKPFTTNPTITKTSQRTRRKPMRPNIFTSIHPNH